MEINNLIKNQITNMIQTAASREATEAVSTSDTLSLSAQVVHFLQTAWQLLPALALGIMVVVLCYYLARPISYLLIKPIGYVSKSRLLHLVTRRFISVLVIFFGIYIFLRLAGLSEFAVAVMSGTGLVGLILGFAFRDIAENFISSMLLSVQRPFRIDDVIEVDNRLGIVKKVTARATTLVDYDGNHIQIPNATVYKNVIKNFTANPKTRGHFKIGIGYDNDIRLTQQIAIDLLKEQSAVLNDPPPQVLLEALGSATINLTIYFWVNSEQHSPIKVASQLMRETVNCFTEHGISMPDDARERIIIAANSETQGATKEATSNLSSSSGAFVKQKNKTTASAVDADIDDVSSDADEIREQAERARSPEEGDNII
ncbi:mechanosensitive ion channel family protein [Pseudoalteromonas piscicida]|uniref:mechanosensitive ion channel family protein n=1 Tax=Pseudoalteromonas piscicida TaxID=43662 RepID=UPI001EFDFDCA|nr:mechanosensitive ion channel family protein [Pseudoalteromonas piscicida]MCG9767167.1 mechanosensitive ion channel family protein [Pseudoalteromonas piscicida]